MKITLHMMAVFCISLSLWYAYTMFMAYWVGDRINGFGASLCMILFGFVGDWFWKMTHDEK